jgi:hypothetical protein
VVGETGCGYRELLRLPKGVTDLGTTSARGGDGDESITEFVEDAFRGGAVSETYFNRRKLGHFYRFVLGKYFLDLGFSFPRFHPE